MKIYAHYRVYAYTNGSIGNDSNYFDHTPQYQLDSQPDYVFVPFTNPDGTTNFWGGPKWKDWTIPPNGSYLDLKWLSSPVSTYPSVCSSFIWQAVQLANQHPAPPSYNVIRLDDTPPGPYKIGDDQGKCIRSVPPDFSGDVKDGITADGQYLYDENSRKQAAQWLYDQIVCTNLGGCCTVFTIRSGL